MIDFIGPRTPDFHPGDLVLVQGRWCVIREINTELRRLAVVLQGKRKRHVIEFGQVTRHEVVWH